MPSRRRSGLTLIADWVILSEASRDAKLLYQLFTIHARTEDDGGPPLRRQAMVETLGLPGVESFDALVRELASIGAIEIYERIGFPRGDETDTHAYIVHDTPPPDR